MKQCTSKWQRKRREQMCEKLRGRETNIYRNIEMSRQLAEFTRLNVRRQTDTQTDRHRQTDTDKHRQTDTDRQTDRQTDRKTDIQTDRQIDTDRQTDRQTDRLVDTNHVKVMMCKVLKTLFDL